MFTQRGAKKKILAMLVILGLAGSAVLVAVDTKETTSVAPIAENYIVHTDPALRDLSRHGLEDDGRSSRSTPRPTIKPIVKPVKPPVVKPKPKTVKPKKHVVKKPVIQKRKVYKKKTYSTKSHRGPGGIAACIRKYESGGNYRAQNPHSTASGAYQFLDSTWHGLGYSGRAMDASPSTQDAAFYRLWAGGRNASQWVTAHKCGY